MHGLSRRSRQKKFNCCDVAHDHGFELVQLVPDEFHVVFERDRHPLLHPAVGAPDGTCLTSSVQSRRSPQHFKHLWRALVRQLARLEDSLIGDVLGVLFLFSGLVAFLWLAPVAEGFFK